MMGELHLVIRGVLAQWLALIVRAVFAIILVPVVIRELGGEMYGIVILVTIIVGLSQLADFGFGQALSRELVEHRVTNDRYKLGTATSTGLCFYGTLAMILSGLIFMMSKPVLLTLGLDESNLQIGSNLLYWYAIPSMVISLLTPPFAANLISSNRFDILRMIDLLGTLSNGIGLIVLLPRAEDKITTWVGVTMVTRGGGFLATALAARFFCGNLGIALSSIRISQFAEVLKLGGRMYVMQLASMLTDKSDPIFLSHFRGQVSLSIYQPATQLSVMLRPLVGSLANQLHPSTTRSHVSGDAGRMKELLFLGTRYTLLVGIGACVIAFTLSSGFCKLWLGETPDTDWQTSAWVMKGWLIADLCQYMGGVQWAILVGMKRLRVMVSGMLAASFINVAATYILMRFTDLGIAWVTVPTILVTLALRPCLAIYASRLCGVTLRTYWKLAYARPMLIGALLSLTCWLLIHIIPSDTLFGLIAIGSIASATWVTLLWNIGLKDDEKAMIRKRLPVLR